jgi:hypothetical protein
MQTPYAEGAATVAVAEVGPAVPPRISWGAVLAGAVVGVAAGLSLNILGAAVGASVVDAVGQETPDARTLGIVGGIWLIVANLIGLAIGGYVAARLSGTADATDSILHGLSVWAVGVLIAAALTGNLLAGAASTVSQGVSAIAGGASEVVGEAAGAVAGPMAERVDPRQVIERAQSALRTGGDPAAMTSEQRGAEIAQLLTQRVTRGELDGGQRQRLSALVAAEYGIAPEEAERRLQQVEAQATATLREAEQRAREAADAAATGAAVAAYWLFAALLFGAIAAVIGARLGARRRVILDGAARRAAIAR